MLNIQKWLTENNGGFAKLEAEFHITAKPHGKYPNLVLFKYDQIESDFKIPMVRECRGIILDSADSWKIICRGYDKFFNFGESQAANIDWKTARVYEKVDGSLMQCFYYDNEWQVATSGTPDAMGQVGATDKTFKDLFWETFHKQGLKTSWLGTGATFMFELCSPWNRVVVDHKESFLVLHGVRDMTNQQELKPETNLVSVASEQNGLRPLAVKSYPLSSIEECQAALNKMNPLQQEGFVVVDANFNRVKIKSPAYVAIHHMKDSACSSRKMALVIRNGEFEEFKTAVDSYPEFKEVFASLVHNYQCKVEIANVAYNKFKHLENQKEFALSIKDLQSGVQPILFSMRRHGKTPEKIMAEMTEPAFFRLMGID